MKTTPSAPLSRHLSLKPAAGKPRNPTSYLLAGATCVNAGDLSGLRKLLPQVRKKSAAITDSMRLRHRIEVLADYFQDSPAGASPAQREVAFVLYYFLKGYDFIPDSIPEIGLLDDALLVESVLLRNQHVLCSHWAARRRAWPENI